MSQEERFNKICAIADSMSNNIIPGIDKLYFDEMHQELKEIFGHVNLLYYYICVFIMAKAIVAHYTDGYKKFDDLNFEEAQEMLDDFPKEVIAHAQQAIKVLKKNEKMN